MISHGWFLFVLYRETKTHGYFCALPFSERFFFFKNFFAPRFFDGGIFSGGGSRNSNLRSIILTGEMIVENVWERVAEIGGRCFQGEKFGIR